MSTITDTPLSVRTRPDSTRSILRGRRADLVFGFLVLLLIATTFVGPVFSHDAERTVTAAFSAPSAENPLGTDQLGRDVLARLLAGGSSLISVAAVSTVVAVVVGVGLGLVTARRSAAGSIVSGLLDVVLVIPAMLTMLVLIFGLGAGIGTMALVTTAVSAPFIARYTRALSRPLLDSDWVLAARAGGDSWPRVLAIDIAPVLAGPIAADAGARFVGALYLVASAAYLGFDPLGTDIDWATMVQSGLQGIRLNPWACLAPAIAIALLTVSTNLFVDRLVQRSSR